MNPAWRPWKSACGASRTVSYTHLDVYKRQILSEMRMALGAAVERSGGAVSLRQMGITTGAWYEYGRLYLDENKLRSALTEDPDAVRELFKMCIRDR